MFFPEDRAKYVSSFITEISGGQVTRYFQTDFLGTFELLFNRQVLKSYFQILEQKIYGNEIWSFALKKSARQPRINKLNNI